MKFVKDIKSSPNKLIDNLTKDGIHRIIQV